jgi:hypothetical protein
MSDLQRQLPWITHALKPFPDSYIAPSFSWASVSSEVFWPHMTWMMRRPLEEGDMENPGADQVQYLTTVVDGDCSLSTSDRFGRVHDGSIKLSGPVMDGFVRSSPKLEIAYDPKHSNLQQGGSFCADGPLRQTILSSRGKPLITVQRSDGEKGQSFDWTPVKLLFLQRRCEVLRGVDDPPEPFSFDAMVLGQRLGLVISICRTREISFVGT